MKNLKRIVFTVLLGVLLMFSCTTEPSEDITNQKQIEQSEIEVQKISDLLDAVKPKLEKQASKLKDFDFITFEVVKNLETNAITLDNFQTISVFPISSIKDYYNTDRSNYVVTCDNGGDGSDNWTETCDGLFSCGEVVKRCLDEGGCASVCNEKNQALSKRMFASVKMTFVPVRNF